MPTTEQQALTAKIVIERMQTYYDSPIVTTIEEPTHFTIAEEYHHDYYARNPDKATAWLLWAQNQQSSCQTRSSVYSVMLKWRLR